MFEFACFINGPAHPNAILVAVYPALFFIQGGCGEAKNCSYLLWSYFFSFLFLLAIVNRSMTLYLSYKRAWSFYNVTNALKSQEQYHHRVLIDLTVFTTIFAITQLLSLLHFGEVLCLNKFSYWHQLKPFSNSCLKTFNYDQSGVSNLICSGVAACLSSCSF